MNTTFKVSIKKTGIVYKSINTPIIKKVLQYVIIDGRLMNSNEWNKEINNEDELKEFAIRKEFEMA